MTDAPQSRAAAFLLGRINFERNPLLATRQAFKQERMRRLLEALGNPQERIPAVHIAGTKGKGSTAVMVAAALDAAGIRAGLYTSPHVESFTERMQVGGIRPTTGQFDELLDPVAEAIARLDAEAAELEVTFFEALTAMAWVYFERQRAELAVLEVGLGGRLDATNLCRPAACAITNISRDHTHILGNTLAAIAFEKAGIIKPGIPCVSGVEESSAAAVIRNVARERGAPLIETAGRFAALPPTDQSARWRLARSSDRSDSASNGRPLRVPLAGEHQAANAAVARTLLATIGQSGFSIQDEHVAAGWQRVAWPARIEVVFRKPVIILDAAHNWASAAALARSLERDFHARRRVLLFAGSQEKDVAGILRQLAGLFETVVLTAFERNPRALPLDRLEQLWQTITSRPAHLRHTPAEALAFCRSIAQGDDLICATGSFFLAAELRPLLVDKAPR